MNQDCACCARPVADVGLVCHSCTVSLTVALLAGARYAGDAEITVARLDHVTRVSGGRPQPAPDDGWRNGGDALQAVPLPVNLTAAEQLWAARNTATTWARHIASERGRELPTDRLAAILCWLAGQCGWVRMRPEAEEAFDELHDAVSILRRIVDRPAGRTMAGRCDCGEYLYAVRGKPLVTCQACGTAWDVAAMREHLRSQVDGMVFTAAELATLAVHLGVSDNRQRVRHLVNVWATRGLVIAHGEYEGAPAYLFAEVMTRLSAVLVTTA